MKVSINKKAFTLDEKSLIEQVKTDLHGCITPDIIQDCARFILNDGSINLIAIESAEICKNHFHPTIWVNAIVRGWDKKGRFFAEIGFDLAEAITHDERAKDAYIVKYNESPIE